MGFLSGAFRGSQLNSRTVEKEGFDILAAFQRLGFLPWQGVHISCDHQNLAFISGPEACRGGGSKPRIRGWSTGARSSITSGVTCCHDKERGSRSFFPRERGRYISTLITNYSLPTKEVIRKDLTVLLHQLEIVTPADLAWWQQNDVYRVTVDVQMAMRIPDGI